MVAGDDHSMIVIGKIQLIMVKDGGLFFIVAETPYSFVSEIGLYQQVSCQIKYSCVDVLTLTCSQCVVVYETNNRNYVSLKSLKT